MTSTPSCRCWLLIALLAAVAALPAEARDSLAGAQELLDRGEPEAALAMVEPLLAGRAKNAAAWLLASTAHFMLGDRGEGKRQLDTALEIDPTLRQGWLNRGAFELSEGRLDAALAALLRAQKLDPEALDNDLNLGAVRVLRGELTAANTHFAAYLAQQPDSADAYYLVATNYAVAGYAALAVEHLARAIALDERRRLEARTDANFADLIGNPRFDALLASDSYVLPSGAHLRRQSFPAAYQCGDGPLLNAVIDALRAQSEPFDPRIEVTPGWALLWSDLRIRVSDGAEGRGQVELSAPAERFTTAEWQRRTDRLLAAIASRADGIP